MSDRDLNANVQVSPQNPASSILPSGSGPQPRLGFATERDSAPDLSGLGPAGRLVEYWCAVAVAQELHFTRAAHRLHMDQSALSRHIQKLESSLGLKLFIRGERKIELTEAAEAFVPFAKKTLLAATAGVRIAQAISRGEPQEFEIAYSTVVDAHLIAQIKMLVENARPRIPIRLRSFPWGQLIGRLLEGTSHAAIALLPVEEDVAMACVLREALSLVVSSDHPLAQAAHVSISEIGDEAIIWPTGVMPPAVTTDVFTRFRRAGYVPNVSHEAQTVAESLGLAREGLGITFVKTSDRSLAGDGLKVLPLTAAFPLKTGLLYIRERRWDFLNKFVVLVRHHFGCEGQVLKNINPALPTNARNAIFVADPQRP